MSELVWTDSPSTRSLPRQTYRLNARQPTPILIRVVAAFSAGPTVDFALQSTLALQYKVNPEKASQAMTHYGTWVSYGGSAKIVLAIVLLAAAAAVAYAGVRLRLPIRAARRSEPATTRSKSALRIILITGVFAIVAFLFCLSLYVQQLRRDHLLHAPAADPITPVTVIGVGAIFLILLISSSDGPRPTLASAAIGAMAAPMIFEFPFDLIVMARTYPPIPPDPALYRALFFVPLLLIEVTALSLLAWSPMVRLSRPAFFFFSSMLAVFAIWGLFGFAYPSAPAPIALNVLSKLLAFAAALSLFLPRRADAITPVPGVGAGTVRTSSDALT